MSQKRKHLSKINSSELNKRHRVSENDEPETDEENLLVEMVRT